MPTSDAPTGLPTSVWMLKPLTKIADAAAAGQNVFGGLFRGLRDDSKWEKRHVSILIENNSGQTSASFSSIPTSGAIVYGRSIDNKDKKIKFETIRAVRSLEKSQMLDSKCPSSHSTKGWVLTTTDGKEVLWAVYESVDNGGETIRDEWVDFLQEMLGARQRMMMGVGGAGVGGAAAAGGAADGRGGGASVSPSRNNSNQQRRFGGEDDEDEDDDFDLDNNDSQHQNPTATSTATTANFNALNNRKNDDDNERNHGGRSNNNANNDDDYVDEDGNVGRMRHKSQKELNRLVGGGGEYDDDEDEDIANYLNNDNHGEDYGDDDDDIDIDDDAYFNNDDGGKQKGSANNSGKDANNNNGGPSPHMFESKEQIYKKILFPIAIRNASSFDINNITAASASSWEKNNYIYLDRERMKNYKSHLLSGDVMGKLPSAENNFGGHQYSAEHSPTFNRLVGGNIRFARFMIKIAKRDNYHERDIIITDNRLYLFAKGSFGRWIPRVVDIDQIVGVVESTSDPSIFAIIVPSFHDIFLKVKVGEHNGINNDPDKLTPVELKRQIIAHLFFAHMKLVTNRNFIFREAENVAAVIRRTEDDQHLPLMGKDDDRLRIASNKDLYPALRTNADTIVYFSCYCERISASHEMRKRGFVVTDNAIYTVTEKLDDIARRTGLSEIHQAFFNMAELKVLFKGGDTDTLVAFRAEEELVRLIELVGMVTLKAVGKQLDFVPYGDLFSRAQLVGNAKILKFVTPEMSQAKIRKMFRKIGTKSVSGVGLLGTGVKAVGGFGFQTIKTVGKGVGGVLVDNAVAGEFIGMLSAAGNAMAMGANLRLIFETILSVEDEDKALAAPRPYPDRLQLARKDSMVASHELGEIYFSSRCKTYNLSSHIDTEKTEQRIVCVSSDGGLHFFVPHDNAGFTIMKLFSSNKGLEVDIKLELSTLKGIVTCELEPTVVGLLTSRHSDILLRLPNETSARQFVRYLAAAATRFGTVAQMVQRGASNSNNNGALPNNGGRLITADGSLVDDTSAGGGLGLLSLGNLVGGSKSAAGKNNAIANAAMLNQAAAAMAASHPFSDYPLPVCLRAACPIYSVVNTQQLKHVLRKTLLDPSPTVACRANLSSDILFLSRVPQLIEVSRRYGDNTIHFSGMAWRFRKRTAKKGEEKMSNKLESAQTSDERKYFKSFVLMLTNAAIYDCTKGNYSITRRIPFKKIKRILLSTEDPDAVLFQIPGEFDALFRIEGRRKEFMDRLQEVYLANWTDFGWYRPGEALGSHNPAKYFFPVTNSRDIVHGSNLTTPKDWQARQGAILPTRVADATRFFYEEDMRRANNMYRNAIIAAAEATSAASEGGEGAASGGNTRTYLVNGGGTSAMRRNGSLLMPANNNGGSGNNNNMIPLVSPPWAVLWQNIVTAASRVKFAYCRAYLYGVRPNMAPALRPTAEYAIDADDQQNHFSSPNNQLGRNPPSVANLAGGVSSTSSSSNANASSSEMQPMALCAQKMVDFCDLSILVRSLQKAIGTEAIERYNRLVAHIKKGKNDGGKTEKILSKMISEQLVIVERLSEKRKAVEEISEILESGDRITQKRQQLSNLIEDAIAAKVDASEIQRVLLEIDSKLQGERIENYLLQFAVPRQQYNSSSSSIADNNAPAAVISAEAKGWTLTEKRTLLDACSDLKLFVGFNARVHKLITGGPRDTTSPLNNSNNNPNGGGGNNLLLRHRGSCEGVDIIVEALHYGISSGSATTLEEAIDGARQQMGMAASNGGGGGPSSSSPVSTAVAAASVFGNSRLLPSDIECIQSEIAAAEEELSVLKSAETLVLDLDQLRGSNPPYRLYNFPVAQLKDVLAGFESLKERFIDLSSTVTTTTTTTVVKGFNAGATTTTSTASSVHASGGKQLRRAALQIHIDVCQLYINRIRTIAAAKSEEEDLKKGEIQAQKEYKKHLITAHLEAKQRAEASEAQRVLEMHERLEGDVTAWAVQAEEIYRGIQKAIASNNNNTGNNKEATSSSSSASIVNGVNVDPLRTFVRAATTILENLTSALRIHPQGYEDTNKIAADTPVALKARIIDVSATIQRIRSQLSTATKFADRFIQVANSRELAQQQHGGGNDSFFGPNSNNAAMMNHSNNNDSFGNDFSDHKDTISIPPSILRAIELQDKPAMVEALTRHNQLATASAAAVVQYQQQFLEFQKALEAHVQQQQQQQQMTMMMEGGASSGGGSFDGASGTASGTSASFTSPSTTPAAADVAPPQPPQPPTITKPLNLATLAEIKRLWAVGARQKLWVEALHKSLTSATSMGNTALLKAHLDRAEERRYSDDIVRIAQGRYRMMVGGGGGGSGGGGDGADEETQQKEDKSKNGINGSQHDDGASSPNPRRPKQQSHNGGGDDDDFGGEGADGTEKNGNEQLPTSSNNDNDDASSSSAAPAPQPLPTRYRKPAIIPLEHAYDTQSPFPCERIAADLLLATMMLLRDCNNKPTEAAAIPPNLTAEEEERLASNAAAGAKTPGSEKMIIVPEASPEVKALVNMWVTALEHNVKPSGIFKKVPRTLYDVLKILGETELPQSRGSLAAPYTNRIVADFDRIKEFNTPGGNTASYFLLTFMLYRGCLVPVLTELLFSVPPKARADLFLEGAFMRSDKCFKDVMSIAYMCEQVQWSFEFAESSIASLQQKRMMSTAAASPSMANFNNNTNTQAAAAAAGINNDSIARDPSLSLSGLSFLKDTPSASGAASPVGGGRDVDGGFGSPSITNEASPLHRQQTPANQGTASSPSMLAASPSGGGFFSSPGGGGGGAAELTSNNEVPLGIAAGTVANSLRQAVKLFGDYYYEGLEKIKQEKKKQGNNSSGGTSNNNKAVTAKPTPEEAAALLDERTHKGIALVVRNAICPAIAAALSVGYRSKSFMSRRYLWEFIVASGLKLKESMRDLQAVAIPEGIELIMNITDPDGRNKIFMNRLSEEQIASLRFRMFVCHLLNTNAMHAFLSSVFSDDCAQSVQMAIYQNPAVNGSIQSMASKLSKDGAGGGGGGQQQSDSNGADGGGGPSALIAYRAVSLALMNSTQPLKETPLSLIANIAPKHSKDQIAHLHKFYHLDRCLLLCMHDSRVEILKIAATLSKLKFSLVIDAEVW